MKRRFMAVLAVFAVTLATSASALAFDCMRVSSSMQGLKKSASRSGMWTFLDMTPSGGGVAEVGNFLFGPGANPPGPLLTSTQVACFQTAYDNALAAPNSVVPKYFALGTGVAGGKTNGPGVLAHNNPNSNVLSNGTGIDHFDDTVLPVFLAAAPTCLA